MERASRSFILPVALTAAVLVSLVSSCASSPEGTQRRPVVSVGGSTLPTITWRPDGAVYVRVYRGITTTGAVTSNLMWAIAASRYNSISSPVSYGIVPPGATLDASAQSLRAGELYTIVVARMDTTAAGDSIAVFEGSTTFTP